MPSRRTLAAAAAMAMQLIPLVGLTTLALVVAAITGADPSPFLAVQLVITAAAALAWVATVAALWADDRAAK